METFCYRLPHSAPQAQTPCHMVHSWHRPDLRNAQPYTTLTSCLFHLHLYLPPRWHSAMEVDAGLDVAGITDTDAAPRLGTLRRCSSERTNSCHRSHSFLWSPHRDWVNSYVHTRHSRPLSMFLFCAMAVLLCMTGHPRERGGRSKTMMSRKRKRVAVAGGIGSRSPPKEVRR